MLAPQGWARHGGSSDGSLRAPGPQHVESVVSTPAESGEVPMHVKGRPAGVIETSGVLERG